VAAMGRTLKATDGGFTLTMPDGEAPSSHADASSALAHLAYVARLGGRTARSCEPR